VCGVYCHIPCLEIHADLQRILPNEQDPFFSVYYRVFSQ